MFPRALLRPHGRVLTDGAIAMKDKGQVAMPKCKAHKPPMTTEVQTTGKKRKKKSRTQGVRLGRAPFRERSFRKRSLGG
jgi:hypothetical protein